MVLHEVEFPHALHREEALRLALVALGLLLVLEGEEYGTAGLAVHLVHTGVFPHGSLVGGNGRGRGQTDE